MKDVMYSQKADLWYCKYLWNYNTDQHEFQDNIWTTKCVRRCSIVTSQQIQDGGRPPFWRSLNHHISVKNRPILMKFGTLHHILKPITVTDQKLKFLKFKIAAAPSWKSIFLAITHRPIVRFQWNFVWGSRTACPQGLNDKICKYLNPRWRTAAILKIVKSPLCQWKIVRFWWNSVQIANAVVTWPKIETFNNSRWRRPPSWKSLFWP